MPGLPTTIFLIAASYLFMRSCPWLEDRLIRIRPFRPYLQYLDGQVPMPRRAKLAAIVLMWVAISFSLGMLFLTAQLRPWLGVVIVAAGCVGTYVIATRGRRR